MLGATSHGFTIQEVSNAQQRTLRRVSLAKLELLRLESLRKTLRGEPSTIPVASTMMKGS